MNLRNKNLSRYAGEVGAQRRVRVPRHPPNLLRTAAKLRCVPTRSPSPSVLTHLDHRVKRPVACLSRAAGEV
jgi:hypothetical protein